MLKMGRPLGKSKSLGSEEVELLPKVKYGISTSRKIKKFHFVSKKSSSDNSIQEGGKSDAPISNDKPALQQTTRDIKPTSKMEMKLVSFGPHYNEEVSKKFLKIKEHAFEHVLAETPGGDSSKAREVYMSIIREVVTEPITHYDDYTLNYPEKDFRLMMLKDACLFLQLALMLILGSSAPLGYPDADPIFGNRVNKVDMKMWIESMFLVGNQIPLVVLKKILEQDFFQTVSLKEKRDPSHKFSLCHKVLNNLLFLPSTKGQKSPQTEDDQQPPFDLLHGLYNHILGTPEKQKSKIKGEPAVYDIDLEANNEISASDTILNELFNRTPSADGTVDQKRTFSSATELFNSSVRIKVKKSGGVKSIDFKSRYFWANLYLPPFHIDEYTEIMFRNLIAYETSHQPQGVHNHNHRGEVSSYIQLMSDLVRTAKDVSLLKSRKIIQFNGSTINPNYDDELPKMLTRLSNQDTPLAHDFQLLTHKMRNYHGPPWNRIKSILNVVVVLGVVQTVFTVVAYIYPRNG